MESLIRLVEKELMEIVEVVMVHLEEQVALIIVHALEEYKTEMYPVEEEQEELVQVAVKALARKEEL
jgi:hypothetical protein